VGRFHLHAEDDAHVGTHAHQLPPERDVGDHSGYGSGPRRVEVLESILSENDRVAEANRSQFARADVRVVNLMSSPGAGKTSLLAAALARLGEAAMRVGILEGDIETSLDADRLDGFGAQVALVNTRDGFGGECHLDATMVQAGLAQLDLDALDLVIIENVGNLVCPAEFAVGETAKAMVYAVTEGEDKPRKYPVMFRAVELVVVNKIDLLEHLDFDLDLFTANLQAINPGVRTVLVSAKTGEGLDEVCRWLRGPA
jgi:hydrogenase nickel incorporation protein HypB